jgi:transcriptional regulator with XRE-family HTH domain
LPFCHVTLRGSKPLSTAMPREIKSLGDHLRAVRLAKGLFQKDVAAEIGVDICTVTNWELNATEPEERFVPAILRFLQYDPVGPGDSPAERLHNHRRRLGITQRKLAGLLGVDPGTLRDWERGTRKPPDRVLSRLGDIAPID